MPRQTARQRKRAANGDTGPRKPERVGSLGQVERKYRSVVRTHLNPEVEQTLVDALKAGNYVTNACTLAGISQKTLYAWLKRADEVEAAIADDPERDDLSDDDFRYLRLRDRLARARADAQEMAVDSVRRQMMGGQLISRRPALNSDGLPIYDGGKLTYEETWTQPDGRLAMQFLAVSFPQEWGKSATTRFEIVNADGETGAAPGERPDPSSGISSDAVGAVAARLMEMQRAAKERQEMLALTQGGDNPVDDGAEPPEDALIEDAEIVEE